MDSAFKVITLILVSMEVIKELSEKEFKLRTLGVFFVGVSVWYMVLGII